MRPFLPNLSKCLVTRKDNIREVVRRIDLSRIGIVLFVDEDNRLVTTVTDGDVRRAMLAGVSFDEPIDRLLDFKSISAHQKPIAQPVSASEEELLAIMQEADVQHIPLLDPEGRVVDL